MSTLSGLFSRGVGGAEVENLREKKNSLKCCQLFFFWCWCLFSVGNDLLAARVELSKCQCCRVEALRAEADVAFFSSHVSHLGVVVPAMFSATWAGSLSVSPHVLTWFEELVLCFVEMFCWGCKREYSINNTAQMERKKKADVHFPLYPGIICLEEGLCNGCRQLLVVWTAWSFQTPCLSGDTTQPLWS